MTRKPTRKPTPTPAPKPDMVSHPPHYQGAIETIDGIHAALGDASFVDYCRGQVLKYAWRAGKKGSMVEDLQKAGWYAAKGASVAGGSNE